MSAVAAALAFELGVHIDDLIDEGVNELETPDGEKLGVSVVDSTPADGDLSFHVILSDGSKLLVKVEAA